MPIESIGRVSIEETAQQGDAIVNLDEFLQIFLTQLNFQDPLEPVDNREFLAQLAQFSAVEIANRNNENTNALVEVNSVTQLVDLLGKSASFNSSEGLVLGVVSAIEMNNGNPTLTITRAGGDPVRNLRPSDINVVND